MLTSCECQNKITSEQQLVQQCFWNLCARLSSRRAKINKEGQKKEKRRRRKSECLAGGEQLVLDRIQLVCCDLINWVEKTNKLEAFCVCVQPHFYLPSCFSVTPPAGGCLISHSSERHHVTDQSQSGLRIGSTVARVWWSGGKTAKQPIRSQLAGGHFLSELVWWWREALSHSAS